MYDVLSGTGISPKSNKNTLRMMLMYAAFLLIRIMADFIGRFQRYTSHL